jgi:predicted transcriptional regulator
LEVAGIRSLPAGTALTVELLSAYLANHTVDAKDVPDLIRLTRMALIAKTAPVFGEASAASSRPAVSVRKSLASSACILSLIDGKPYRTLRRHLTAHGLTPESYRARYNLPADYPMVAPDYAEFRRTLAKQVGLGKPGTVPELSSDEPSPGTVHVAAGIATAHAQVQAGIEQDPEVDANASSLSFDKTVGSKRQTGALAVDTAAEAEPVEIKESTTDPTKLRANVLRSDSGAVRPAESISRASEVPRPPAMEVESTSRRLILMEAVARRRAVTALYNGALIKLAPHQIFERHGELFLAALNLSKSWRADEEGRLGQFKFVGLTEVNLVAEIFGPLPSYNGMLPRADDKLILSI